MSLSFIKTSQGTLNVVTSNGRSFHVGSEHPNYKTLLEAIREGDEKKFVRNVDIPKAIARKSSGLVEVVNGEVVYQGEPVHNVVATRILDLMNAGLPFEPMMKFLANLMENPSRRSVEQLYTFLENRNLPITDDGCFLGYKAVRNNYHDKHSGKVNYSPGNVVKVPRSSVDDDFRNQCSYGLHVGGIEYVRSFGSGDDRFLLVKVNPKHAVAVPTDYDCQKLRVEQLEVVREVSRDFVLENVLYAADGNDYVASDNEIYEDSDDWDDDDFDVYAEEQAEDDDLWDYENEPVYTEEEHESDVEDAFQRGFLAAKREFEAAKTVNSPVYQAKPKRDSHGRFSR